MTLSATQEQTLRAPLDRRGDPPSRRVARIAGIFMVITFISIPALPLYDRVLHHTNFIVGAGGDGRVYVGALFEILTLIAGIGMAVTLYPVLRRQSESLALGYVTVRVVESCLIAVGIVSLLAVVTLRQDLAGATGTDNASLILSGRSLVAVHDATFLLGPAFCAAIGNGLILGYLMLRSGLVPRRFAQFGIAGGSLALRDGASRVVRRLRPEFRSVVHPDAAGGGLGAVARHLPDRQGLQAVSHPLRRRTPHRRGRPAGPGTRVGG